MSSSSSTISGGQKLTIRSGGSANSTKRSNTVEVRRAAAQAAIATPPARPASRARRIVIRHSRRSTFDASNRAAPTGGLPSESRVGPTLVRRSDLRERRIGPAQNRCRPGEAAPPGLRRRVLGGSVGWGHGRDHPAPIVDGHPVADRRSVPVLRPSRRPLPSGDRRAEPRRLAGGPDDRQRLLRRRRLVDVPRQRGPRVPPASPPRVRDGDGRAPRPDRPCRLARRNRSVRRR